MRDKNINRNQTICVSKDNNAGYVIQLTTFCSMTAMAEQVTVDTSGDNEVTPDVTASAQKEDPTTSFTTELADDTMQQWTTEVNEGSHEVSWILKEFFLYKAVFFYIYYII